MFRNKTLPDEVIVPTDTLEQIKKKIGYKQTRLRNWYIKHIGNALAICGDLFEYNKNMDEKGNVVEGNSVEGNNAEDVYLFKTFGLVSVTKVVDAGFQFTAMDKKGQTRLLSCRWDQQDSHFGYKVKISPDLGSIVLEYKKNKKIAYDISYAIGVVRQSLEEYNLSLSTEDKVAELKLAGEEIENEPRPNLDMSNSDMPNLDMSKLKIM